MLKTMFYHSYYVNINNPKPYQSIIYIYIYSTVSIVALQSKG